MLARLGRRLATLWAVEVVALLLLAWLLPGLSLTDWRAAIVAVAAIALLNALVRPVLLFLTLPVTVLTLGLASLLLNAASLWLAAQFVPGLTVEGRWTPVLAALGLAALNALATNFLAITDEGSFYRSLVRRVARRSARIAEVETPGVVMIEIDGLAAPILEQAIAAGYMPTLARWVASGSHRFVDWDCGLPSQTSASQAGILYGRRYDVPAFRWYEKDRHRLLVSNWPQDAAEIERRVTTADGLLRRDGSSLCNIVAGGAPRTAMTLSTITSLTRSFRHRTTGYYLYFLNPYSFSRAFVLMIGEMVRELWERASQNVRDVRPRVSRGRTFPFLRAISTVLMRDLTAYLVVEDMFAAIPTIYGSFIGYDVVAHHAGPARPDALRVLRGLDRQLAALEQVARDAPRPYQFVVLSDHGQSQGATFRQRYGRTLDQFIHEVLRGEHPVHASAGQDDGWAYLSALVTEAVRDESPGARAARRMLARRTEDGVVVFGPERERAQPRPGDVVVCASGNLGLIYLTDRPGRLNLEDLLVDYPGLVEALVTHEGIGFVLVRSRSHGSLVLGRSGMHALQDDRVEGADPLAPFGSRAAEHLRYLDSFPHVGDLVVNSGVDPVTGEIAAFEELVGSHGGLGGMQTSPFMLFPAAWPFAEREIVGPEALHDLLRGWIERLQPAEAAPPVTTAAVDGPPLS